MSDFSSKNEGYYNLTEAGEFLRRFKIRKIKLKALKKMAVMKHTETIKGQSYIIYTFIDRSKLRVKYQGDQVYSMTEV